MENNRLNLNVQDEGMPSNRISTAMRPDVSRPQISGIDLRHEAFEGQAIPLSNAAEVEESLRERVISLKQEWSFAVTAEGTEYTMRTAVPSDAQKLADLHMRSFPGYPYDRLYKKEYHEACCGDLSIIRVLIADRNENIVAAGALGISPTELQAELEQVVVDPQHRNEGWCDLLVEGLTAAGARIGLHRIYASARTRSPGMQQALLDVDYEPTGITVYHVVYHEEGASMEPMVTMERWLVPKENDIDKSAEQWTIDSEGVLHRLALRRE